MELINTRCTQGRLIITETHIIVELGQMQSETMARSSFVDLDSRQVVPAIFGLGGGVNLAFFGQGNKVIRANLVRPKDAKRVRAILTGR